MGDYRLVTEEDVVLLRMALTAPSDDLDYSALALPDAE